MLLCFVKRWSIIEWFLARKLLQCSFKCERLCAFRCPCSLDDLTFQRDFVAHASVLACEAGGCYECCYQWYYWYYRVVVRLPKSGQMFLGETWANSGELGLGHSQLRKLQKPAWASLLERLRKFAQVCANFHRLPKFAQGFLLPDFARGRLRKQYPELAQVCPNSGNAFPNLLKRTTTLTRILYYMYRYPLSVFGNRSDNSNSFGSDSLSQKKSIEWSTPTWL